MCSGMAPDGLDAVSGVRTFHQCDDQFLVHEPNCAHADFTDGNLMFYGYAATTLEVLKEEFRCVGKPFLLVLDWVHSQPTEGRPREPAAMGFDGTRKKRPMTFVSQPIPEVVGKVLIFLLIHVGFHHALRTPPYFLRSRSITEMPYGMSELRFNGSERNMT